MRLAELLVFLVCIFVHRTTAAAQDCIRAESGGRESLPNFGDPGNRNVIVGANPIQAIITSYEFHCCGIIIGWGAYVQPGGGMHENGAYSITFQVWRPTSTDGNRYVKVGENIFLAVTLISSAIQETLSLDEGLHFQPGDVIGYYLEQNAKGNNGGLQPDTSFSRETMYYATGNTGLRSECVLEVGSTANLSMSTNLGPIISVSFTESDCPQSTTLTEILTASTSPPSPTSNPTLFCPSPTRVVTATEQVTSLAGGNSSVGLITGVTVSALVIGLLAFLLITILLVIVLKKRRLKQSQEIVDMISYSAVNQANEQHDLIEQYHYYDKMEPMTELSTSTNEAYGKHEEATSTGEESYYCVNDHANDPKILTLKNVAFGDNPTSTTRNDEQVNEGLNNPRMTMTQSEAYGDTRRQISSSRGTGSLDDTGSIPTTRNEAYTGVSTNTESVDTEETYDYDYVINL